MNRVQRGLIPKDESSLWFVPVWLLICVLFVIQGTIGFGDTGLDVLCNILATMIFLVVYVMATGLSISAMLSLHADILEYLEKGPPSYVFDFERWAVTVLDGAKVLRFSQTKSIALYALYGVVMPLSLGVAGWWIFAVLAFITTHVHYGVVIALSKSVTELLSTLTDEQIHRITGGD